jgi:hypothetical protein
MVPGTEPAWADLAARLAAELGVERFRFVDDVDLVEPFAPAAGTPPGGLVERHRAAAIVQFNRLLLDERRLLALASVAGLRARQPEAFGRVGKQITVPPDAVG